jgi:hypothetical protein
VLDAGLSTPLGFPFVLNGNVVAPTSVKLTAVDSRARPARAPCGCSRL